MSTLDRRVTALEAIAGEIRLRPLHTLAKEGGIPFERLMECYEACRARTAALRAEGRSEREILAMTAARLGIEPAELERRRDALLARFN